MTQIKIKQIRHLNFVCVEWTHTHTTHTHTHTHTQAHTSRLFLRTLKTGSCNHLNNRNRKIKQNQNKQKTQTEQNYTTNCKNIYIGMTQIKIKQIRHVNFVCGMNTHTLHTHTHTHTHAHVHTTHTHTLHTHYTLHTHTHTHNVPSGNKNLTWLDLTQHIHTHYTHKRVQIDYVTVIS